MRVIENSDVLDMSQFTEGIVDLYNVDGQQIAIPKDVSTIGLWYNKHYLMKRVVLNIRMKIGHGR